MTGGGSSGSLPARNVQRTVTNWEIFIPANEPGLLNKTVTVKAKNWMDALNAGLDELGHAGPDTSNLMLDIKADGCVHVSDLRNGRVFEVKPLAARDEPEEAPEAARAVPAKAKEGKPAELPPPPAPRKPKKKAAKPDVEKPAPAKKKQKAPKPTVAKPAPQKEKKEAKK